MRTMTMRHSALLAWRSPPSWALTLPLVLPDPSDAVTHLWAEGTDDDAAQALLDEWAAVVAQAGR